MQAQFTLCQGELSLDMFLDLTLVNISDGATRDRVESVFTQA
jgi:hypothetical protein